MVSLFEEMGGTYILSTDGMYYPDLQLPKEEMPRYGKYGRMRHTYLREDRKAFYATLLFGGKLVIHLSKIDDAANSKMELIIREMCPVRTTKHERHNRIALSHIQTVQYIAAITV